MTNRYFALINMKIKGVYEKDCFESCPLIFSIKIRIVEDKKFEKELKIIDTFESDIINEYINFFDKDTTFKELLMNESLSFYNVIKCVDIYLKSYKNISLIFVNKYESDVFSSNISLHNCVFPKYKHLLIDNLLSR